MGLVLGLPMDSTQNELDCQKEKKVKKIFLHQRQVYRSFREYTSWSHTSPKQIIVNAKKTRMMTRTKGRLSRS